jgi:hypothetical protein
MAIQRGRKSAASLSIVPLLPGQRHKPPSDLTSEQAAIWRDIAATKPADFWSADNFPLLADYCRHIATANQLAFEINQIIDLSDKAVLSRLTSLLNLRKQETACIVQLATAMRLSQQSRYRADAAIPTTGDQGKPWA